MKSVLVPNLTKAIYMHGWGHLEKQSIPLHFKHQTDFNAMKILKKWWKTSWHLCAASQLHSSQVDLNIGLLKTLNSRRHQIQWQRLMWLLRPAWTRANLLVLPTQIRTFPYKLYQTFRETSGAFGPLIGWAPLELPGTKLTQWQTLEVSDVKNTKREDAKGLLCSFIPSSKTNPGSILVLVCQTLNHFKMHVCYSCWIRLEDAKFG